MGPEHDLPFSDSFTTTEQYVESVLDFAQRDRLLQTLCGGVHILDFFTNSPDLYASILEESWRSFIAAHDIMDFLNLLLREPLDQFDGEALTKWRDGPVPPASLLAYIREVRKHLLLREPLSSQCSRNRAIKPVQKLAWHVAVGMNIKKVHEVGLFASYIENLTSSISQETGHEITHLVDFGSGQNYLGRALASPPYSKHIVAIETKGHNQDRAKQLDEAARLVPVQKFLFDRKAEIASRPKKKSDKLLEGEMKQLAKAVEKVGVKTEPAAANVGTVQYVEHFIKDGDLADVISEIEQAKAEEEGATIADRPQALVMSLHSCGNLVHHGLRSMVLNNDVKAVAMIGCCYNLITERLSPATYKLPELRPSAHPRVEKEHSACDPHGFPMSDRFCNLSGQGIKLNITARMMAVQAPKNWGERDSGARDSDGFFKRHFYRALLQRVFLDKGVVGPPSVEYIGGSPLGHSSGTPIIIGSLRKGCYTTFVAYVRGALGKLVDDSEQVNKFKIVADMTDEEIEDYAERFAYRKKELSAIWSLMAFSAGVVEALIVVDRYLWLKEQPDVARAWAEPVFDYGMSPRNIVVVGVKG